MITFDSSRFYKTKYGGLYLKYEEIEDLTEDLIKDYDESLLKNPKAIEYDDFIEGYLNATLMYNDIYSASSSELVLGCSVFNRQSIPIFDRDYKCKSYIDCEPRTVIINTEVVNGQRKIQENITGLHEAGHIWMHSEQFTEVPGQLVANLFDTAICCRKHDIDDTIKAVPSSINSEEMWREWQANVFAVTIGLPRKSLTLAANDLFEKYGIDTKVLITDLDTITRELAMNEIPEVLKGKYNMSKESIRYRLEKIGLYTTKKKYEEEHRYKQMSIFDFN